MRLESGCQFREFGLAAHQTGSEQTQIPRGRVERPARWEFLTRAGRSDLKHLDGLGDVAQPPRSQIDEVGGDSHSHRQLQCLLRGDGRLDRTLR
jgi:hypothetical protein